MRILFVVPFYKPAYVYGGPVRSIPTLAASLAELGCQVTVYTTNANGKRNFEPALPKIQTLADVKVHYFHRALPGNYFFSPQLGQVFAATLTEFDLVYLLGNWTYPFLSSAFAARAHGLPMVVSPRTSFMRSTWQKNYLKKMLYHQLFEHSLLNSAAALHYTTPLEAQQSAWLRLRPGHFIVPNPVDLTEFEHLPAREIFRRRFQIGDKEHLILHLGRIEPRKGISFALQAFAKLAGARRGCRFVIAGPEEDHHQQELYRQAVSLGLAEQVLFTGYLNPTQRLEALAAADVFILTSYSENFGMSVVEAMASGLPVLVSDQVGVAEQVQQTGAGVVVPLDLPQAAAQLIALVDCLPRQRRDFSQNARRAAHEYSPRQVAEKMLSHLAELAEARRASRE